MVEGKLNSSNLWYESMSQSEPLVEPVIIDGDDEVVIILQKHLGLL